MLVKMPTNLGNGILNEYWSAEQYLAKAGDPNGYDSKTINNVPSTFHVAAVLYYGGSSGPYASYFYYENGVLVHQKDSRNACAITITYDANNRTLTLTNLNSTYSVDTMTSFVVDG